MIIESFVYLFLNLKSDSFMVRSNKRTLNKIKTYLKKQKNVIFVPDYEEQLELEQFILKQDLSQEGTFVVSNLSNHGLFLFMDLFTYLQNGQHKLSDKWRVVYLCNSEELFDPKVMSHFFVIDISS